MKNNGDILIVEDNQDSLKLYADILAKENYHVIPADSGQAALFAAAANRPELILLDIRLPDMDGFEVLRRFRENKDTRGIPVIFLSAETDIDKRTEGLKLGAVDYIPKPFQLSELLARVRIHMELGKLRTTLEQQAEVLHTSNLQLTKEISNHNEAARSLKENEQRYRTLIDYAPVAIFVNRGDRVVLVNRECLRLFGATTPQQLLGKSPYDLFHPDFHPIMRERITALRDKSQAVPVIEEKIIRLDGKVVEVEVNAAPFRDQGAIAIHVILRDISERKKAEEALKESERKLSEAQKMALLGYWTWDIKTGNVEWSEEVFKIFHLKSGSFKPRIDSIMELSPWPEDNQRDQELIRKAMETHEKGSFEQKFLRPNKSIGYYYSTFQGKYDASGNLITIIGTVQDITERKKTEAALKNSEALLKGVVSSVHVGLAITSNRLVEWTNDYLLDIVGRKQEEIIGKESRIFYESDDTFNDVGTRLYRELASNGAGKIETVFKHKDGRLLNILLSGIVLDRADKNSKIIFGLMDITSEKKSEEILRKSEERWRGLFSNSLNGVAIHEIVTDDTGKPVDYIFLMANPAFEKQTGLYVKDIIGKRVTQVLPGIERSGLIETYGKVALEGNSVSFDIYSEPLQRYFNVSAYKVGEKQFAAIFDDISERKLAEKAIKASELRYRRLFESAKDGILILDADTGMVDDVNPFLIKMLGFSREQFKGKAIWELGFLKDTIANREKFLELQRQEYVRYEDLPMETADGRHFNVEFISNVYFVDKKKVIQCNIRDITERRKTEEELHNKAAFLEAQINSSIDGILIVDPHGKKILQNKRAIEMWKIPQHIADDLDDKSQVQHVTKMAKNHEQFIEKIIYLYGHPNETSRDEVELIDGTIIDRYSAPVLGKNGVNYGRIWYFHDLTERKRLEEELIIAHKLDSLGVLAGGIAHDFNNILTGIIGNISIVRYKMDPNDKLHEILNEAEKAAFQAKTLTQQLLTFSKGGAPVKRLTVLSDLLRESATFASRGSKAKCEFRLAPNLNMTEVDPGQIGQVISNIVLNAVQAMPEGGDIEIQAGNINIEKTQKLPLKPGTYVYTSIKDNGNGIPAAHLEKIFDPYFTTKQTGSGLGLATSYSIIKKHGGHITVESEAGKGSVFTFYLPAYKGKTDASGLTKDTELKPGRGRVLVMDDDKMICTFLKRVLTDLGYTVESALDGNDAASLYAETWKTKEAFDIVILDLTVPGGKGGIETLKNLKKLDPNIKAIVSSGYSNDPILANYSKHGFAAVLPKPYDVREVSELLHRLLKK